MEYGDIDLKGLLERERKAGGGKVDLNFIRLTWQQMLQAVDAIHEERIIHADLKPSNFLFVQVLAILVSCEMSILNYLFLYLRAN